MTIVLPYREGQLDGIELKYCLRGIEKYLTGWSNLGIIGTPPEWYKGYWTPQQDYPGRKQYSIYQKLLTACQLEECTDDFVMFNDDHFLIKPLNVTDIKYWYNGLLKDELSKQMGGRYRLAVLNTVELFPEGLNYDIHTPIIYNKRKFRSLFISREHEVCIKSFYCNSTFTVSEFMTDCKIDQLTSKERIGDLIEDRLFFSIGSNGLKPPMIEKLNELYPDKSRWEN